jgi:hypothetical protein
MAGRARLVRAALRFAATGTGAAGSAVAIAQWLAGWLFGCDRRFDRLLGLGRRRDRFA